MRTRRRMVLLAVAVLLSLSALLAIVILLVGHFGETERRILGSTALLAGYGLLGLPSTMLLDQGRVVRLASVGVGLAAVGASLALASVWSGDSPEALGRAVGSTTVFALASAQVSALAARRGARDPVAVHRLFGISCVLAGSLAATVTVLLWADVSGERYARPLAALAVLDLLAVALQPILARARPVTASHRLRIVVAPGETVATDVEAVDLAGAVAKAIRALERDGHHVVRVEIEREPAPSDGVESLPALRAAGVVMDAQLGQPPAGEVVPGVGGTRGEAGARG